MSTPVRENFSSVKSVNTFLPSNQPAEIRYKYNGLGTQ